MVDGFFRLRVSGTEFETRTDHLSLVGSLKTSQDNEFSLNWFTR